MSYPGYPPYPGQGSPRQQNNPPPMYQTAPLSYPMYPGSAAPPPSYPPYQYSSPYPSGNPSPYPPQPSQHPQPFPTQSPYPSSPYPSGNPSPYPGPNPSPYPQPGASPYPSGNPSPYPGSVPVYPSAVRSSYPQSQSQQQSSHGGGHGYAAPLYSPMGPNSHSTTAPQGRPTIVPAHPFNPREDAEVLRRAMKGFGTDEKALIHVLTNRTNQQRQQIAIEFKTLYGKDLISDLKSETSGNFENLLVALMTPHHVFLANECHHAIEGIGTVEETLVEILCTANNQDIRGIVSAYGQVYGKSLESELASDTSGSFKRLLVSLCQGNRAENAPVDQNWAMQDAQALLRAGELQLGTDESTFNAILCTRSYPQLAHIFLEYHRLTGNDFEEAIKNEFSGCIKEGLLAIVRSVRNKAEFFAGELHRAMSGAGTRDRALIRIVVSRSEFDLRDIKDAYMMKYGKSLEDAISSETSGDYKKGLLSIIA